MITNFQDTNILPVYYEALKYKDFNFIKESFLTGLASMGLPENQALAIRIAAEKLPVYPGSNDLASDGPLLGILFMPWESLGLATDSVAPLTDIQRETIFNGVMQICKGIIYDESLRLQNIMTLETDLPLDWNAPEPAPEPTI